MAPATLPPELLPHVETWYAEHGQDYDTPEDAAKACQLVIEPLLIELGISVASHVIGSLIVIWIRNHWIPKPT